MAAAYVREFTEDVKKTLRMNRETNYASEMGTEAYSRILHLGLRLLFSSPYVSRTGTFILGRYMAAGHLIPRSVTMSAYLRARAEF